MPYQPVTNFDDSNGVDLGQKLVTKDYLLTVYGSILDSLGNSELTVTPALWVWGDNTAAQLGVNNATSRSTPVTTILGGTNWKSIAGGGYHTIATKTDGTLWVWGLNSSGELGVNSTTNRSIPVTTILGGTNWKSIAGGDIYRTIATKTDGTLWTWGNNNRGQLGINTTTNRSIPVTTILGGTNWKSISGGGSHTASVKTDGTLWTWGLNSDGQLGVNNTTNRSTPVTTILGGTNWKSVSCGENHMAAIKTDGTLWVWGLNGAGQLGVNNTTNRSTPVTTILGGTNWKQVSCGKDHMAAIKTDGTLWNWGDNGYEQLGVSIGPDRSTPVTTRAGGTNWKEVSCGGYSTTAIKTDGTLWVWGSNYQGQLGTNDTTDRRTPVTTILGGTNWKSVSVGYNTIAIRSDAYI